MNVLAIQKVWDAFNLVHQAEVSVKNTAFHFGKKSNEESIDEIIDEVRSAKKELQSLLTKLAFGVGYYDGIKGEIEELFGLVKRRISDLADAVARPILPSVGCRLIHKDTGELCTLTGIMCESGQPCLFVHFDTSFSAYTCRVGDFFKDFCVVPQHTEQIGSSEEESC